jgi:hypothetical protein
MTSTEAAHSLQVSDAVMKRWLDGTVRVPASAWEMYWTKMHFNRMTHDLTNIVDGDVDRADEILLSHPSAWMRDLMTAYFTIVYDEDMC